MVYDSARNVVVMFGGQDSSGYLGDTWEWDGSNWTQRFPSTSPPARVGPDMAYDSGRAVTVMYGGIATNGNSLNDVWELQTGPTAHLSLSKTQGSFNEPITITGTGFGSSELVNIYDDATTSPPIYTASTDSTGSFVINRSVVAQTYGSHTLIAVGQTSQIPASTTFVMQTSLRLRPTEGMTGQTIGVAGHGYGANELVSLQWDTATGPFLRQDLTNSRGTVTSFFVVPKTATTGQHLIYATGKTSKAQAVAVFSVGSGSADMTNYGSDTVTPIDQPTNTAGAPIPVGNGPDGIAITPTTKRPSS